VVCKKPEGGNVEDRNVDLKKKRGTALTLKSTEDRGGREEKLSPRGRGGPLGKGGGSSSKKKKVGSLPPKEGQKERIHKGIRQTTQAG